MRPRRAGRRPRGRRRSGLPGGFTPLQLQTAREPAGDGAAQAGRISRDGSRLRFCCAFLKERQHLPRPPRNPVRRRRGFAKGESSFLYLPSYHGLSRRDLVHRGLLGKHRWARGDVATWTGHGGPFRRNLSPGAGALSDTPKRIPTAPLLPPWGQPRTYAN